MSNTLFFSFVVGFASGSLLSILVISVCILQQTRRMSKVLQQMVPLVHFALEDKREGF